MYCPNNNPECYRDNYCSCGNNWAIGKLFGWFLIIALGALFIVFVAFGIAAYKIANSPSLFDQQTGKRLPAGIDWLYWSVGTVAAAAFMTFLGVGIFIQVSPLRYGDIADVNSIQIVFPMWVFVAGMALTVLTFTVKNWKLISDRIKEKSFLSAENKKSTVGVATVAAILVLSLCITLSASTYFHVRRKAALYAQANKEQQDIARLMGTFPYEGRYKWPKNDDVFVIKKDGSNETYLRLRLDTDRAGGKYENPDGCLLTPQLKNNYLRFLISQCNVAINEISFSFDGETPTMFVETTPTLPASRLAKIK